MTGANGRWRLVTVRVQDILGFQGECQFSFGTGVQVIEGPNHSGKTSLALATLWGMTGEIPRLPRLDLRSFRLTNRHAGENANSEVEITLERSDGSRMTVWRKYEPGRRGTRPETVRVTIGEDQYEGPEASAVLRSALGVTPGSLEGAGVVLQDHRLRLITGSESDVSDVINDMLGLVNLSQLVPALQEAARGATEFRREVETFREGRDPLRLFAEKEGELSQAFQAREKQAIEAGYPVDDLDDPDEFLADTLNGLVSNLEAEPIVDDESSIATVERLRQTLSRRRQTAPESRELAELEGRRQKLSQLVNRTDDVMKQWEVHDTTLKEAAATGTLEEEDLASTLAQADQQLAEYEKRRVEIADEQGFLEAAYGHILQHPEIDDCPLCQQSFGRSRLLSETRGRLDSRLASELEKLTANEREATRRRTEAMERATKVRELSAVHQERVAEATGLGSDLEDAGIDFAPSVASQPLFTDAEVRQQFLDDFVGFAETLRRQRNQAESQLSAATDALAERERNEFKPVEEALNKARDILVPLTEAVGAIEAHSATRETAEEEAESLESLAEESRHYAQNLTRIARAVSEQEEGRAKAAIGERIDLISGLFRNIAMNPDYTSLEVETKISRDRVTYRLLASSARLRALGDVVGHVLSEGDLSAASIGLLIGLASGTAHNMGFLMLDDPGQGMDPDLQQRLATELNSLDEKPQVIVLTHQPDFAKVLKDRGAAHSVLGRWEGGRNLSD